MVRQLRPQETFDRVAKHLLKQNKQSTRQDSSACLYRGPDGLKCAVGCLIQDSEYHPSMEGVPAILIRLPERFSNVVKSGLLRDLQIVHDAAHPRTWKSELRRLAKDYCLNTKALDQ